MNTYRPNKLFSCPSILSCLLIAMLFAWLTGPAWAETITDQHGREIKFEKPFTRIISLYGAHTENLFYLGAANALIGVSVNDTYPDQIQTKARFSYHDGPEKYLAAQPDLVLIRPMIENGYPGFVRQLRSYGITVISLQPPSIEAMYTYWLSLGKLSGQREAAESLITRFKADVAVILAKTASIPDKKNVYFQAIHARMRTFTPGTMPIFALETAGGINVASDATASRNTNVAVYGKERILAKAGTIDVIIAQKGIMNPVSTADILNEPGFHIIKAVRENQIFLVDESIVSRPVPRLMDGIIQIGNLLYPQIFKQITLTKETI